MAAPAGSLLVPIDLVLGSGLSPFCGLAGSLTLTLTPPLPPLSFQPLIIVRHIAFIILLRLHHMTYMISGPDAVIISTMAEAARQRD